MRDCRRCDRQNGNSSDETHNIHIFGISRDATKLYIEGLCGFTIRLLEY